MKKTIIEMHQVEKIEAIICDVCKVEYDDPMEMQEFLQYSDTAGYSSVFGDMNRLSLDMCQHCVKKILGEYIVVRKKNWAEYEYS
jgi:hypothetical protein